MTESHKKAALYTALNAAQKIMSGAKKDKKNPFFKSNYADLGAVFDAIHYPFAEHGLSVTQVMDVLENGSTVLITRLMHISGEYIESKMLLPDLSDIQKLGSAITYIRRYTLMSIAGIPAEDDDGNSASRAVKYEAAKAAAALINPEPETSITNDQYEILENALVGHDEFRDKILSYLQKQLGVKTMQDMPSKVYDAVLTRIQTHIASVEAQEEAAI